MLHMQKAKRLCFCRKANSPLRVVTKGLEDILLAAFLDKACQVKFRYQPIFRAPEYGTGHADT